MATANISFEQQGPVVAVAEYLQTHYEPDCDYIDGHVEERNVGEWDHARLQAALTALFYNNEVLWGVQVAPEARLQVNPSRFRVPDVVVVADATQIAEVIRTPPLLCIEILSPRDTWRNMETRISDYIAMGVENIWAFDPSSREVFLFGEGTRRWMNAEVLTLPGTSVQIRLEDVFRALQRKL